VYSEYRAVIPTKFRYIHPSENNAEFPWLTTTKNYFSSTHLH
jgi:hypothetical protein